ncbi:MAG: hypothetical protein QT11_C0001G0143 [archaeon GW2011_AR20]|nr:MAG: hypothetical protein QT11_C0001G0143 [archaeon GW2011_AR20]
MNKNAWLKYSETVEEEMHLQFAKITDENRGGIYG